LEIVTADDSWKSGWIEDNSAIVRKIVKANWFSWYFDIAEQSHATVFLPRASSLSNTEFAEALQNSLPRDDKPVPKHDYILHPVRLKT
jgi:hypothetical protein